MERRPQLSGAQLEAFSQDLRVRQDALTGIDARIEELEQKMDALGDDAQLANVDLQDVLQRQQLVLQQLSAISKELHETAMAIVRKIGG